MKKVKSLSVYANQKLDISVVKCVQDNRPEKVKTCWQDFINACSKPEERGSLSLPEYLRANKDTQNEQKNGTAIICGAFAIPDTRSKEDLKSICIATLDLDDGSFSWEDLQLKFTGLECILVTSYSNSEQKAKYRVFVLLDKPITKNIEGTLGLIYDHFVLDLGPHIDKASRTPNQVFFRPAYPPSGGKYFKFKHIKGRPLRTSDFKIVIPDKKTIEAALSDTPKDNRPGVEYNRKGSWGDLLVNADWKFLSSDNGIDYWTRPGKRRGVSAVVFRDSNILYVHSTSTRVSPFEGGKAYSLFSAYTLLKHDGDFSAAASQLRSEGYGTTAKPNGDGQEVAAKARAASRFPVIPFPHEELPDHFMELVHTHAKALHCSPDLTAPIFMAIGSSAVGNAVTLAIKNSWKIVSFFWLALIGDTGSKKSPIINAAMKPIYALQAAEDSRFKREMLEYKTALKLYDGNLKKGLVGVASSEPKPKRDYFCSNFTIEALIQIFQADSRGVVICVDELAGLIKGLNQYKHGGSDVEQILSLFDCGPLKSDRKTGSSSCGESGAAVIGGIQPKILSEVFNEKQQENGMIYRFLPLLIDIKLAPFTEDDISEEVERAWFNLLSWLYNIPALFDPVTGCITKNILTVEDTGKALWIEFHDELDRIKMEMPKQFRGYLPKLITYSLKFINFLHLLKCYPKGKLSLTVKTSTVRGAISITRFFAGQAMRLSTQVYEQQDPLFATARQALISLKDDFKNGKLLLSVVRQKVNERLPENMALDGFDKTLGACLRDKMGLEVRESNGGKTYVYWNADIIMP